ATCRFEETRNLCARLAPAAWAKAWAGGRCWLDMLAWVQEGRPGCLRQRWHVGSVGRRWWCVMAELSASRAAGGWRGHRYAPAAVASWCPTRTIRRTWPACTAAMPTAGGRPVRPARSERLGKTACTDRKSTRLNSSHVKISYAVFCLKKKKKCKC